MGLGGGLARHEAARRRALPSSDGGNPLHRSIARRAVTSLRTFDQTESLATTPGYDDVTGVGSPNGQRFLAALAAAAAR